MGAVHDSIADLSEPATAAIEVQRLNDRLAGEETIPEDVATAVREIAEGVDQTNLRRWETIGQRVARAAGDTRTTREILIADRRT